MNLEELMTNVEAWSRKRGLFEQSSYEKQIEKFFEERAEMFTTDDVEDALGDQMVCLINASYFNPREVSINAGGMNLIEVDLYCGDIQGAIRTLDGDIEMGYDPEECYEKAWNAIKHRVGLMIDGKFVKWDNLTQAQRIKVAQSGQFSDPDTDLAHCKSFCSAEEWTEIIRCKS